MFFLGDLLIGGKFWRNLAWLTLRNIILNFVKWKFYFLKTVYFCLGYNAGIPTPYSIYNVLHYDVY